MLSKQNTRTHFSSSMSRMTRRPIHDSCASNWSNATRLAGAASGGVEPVIRAATMLSKSERRRAPTLPTAAERRE